MKKGIRRVDASSWSKTLLNKIKSTYGHIRPADPVEEQQLLSRWGVVLDQFLDPLVSCEPDFWAGTRPTSQRARSNPVG